MDHIKYTPIQVMKKSDKAEVIFAAVEDLDYPVVVKRLFDANPKIYRVVSGVDNIHIPKIICMEEHPKELLVAEEYIDGRTLDEYLSEETLNDLQKLELAVQICEAMEVLHNCNPPVIHRDIKPSNLMMNHDGVLKIIDFDASRQYNGTKNTSDTRLLGTVEYAAPEQFGYAQTDLRSDIYSAGVVFSEIKIEEKTVAKDWKKLVDKCTSFDPANRYQDAGELKKELEKCIRKIKQSVIKRLGSSLVTGTRSMFVCVYDKVRSQSGEGILKRDKMPKYNHIDQVILVEDTFCWNEGKLPLSVFVREGAPCGIQRGYICKRAVKNDPFSETITPIAGGMYEVSGDGTEMRLDDMFFRKYGTEEETVLYLEFSDGRGERVWLVHSDNEK